MPPARGGTGGRAADAGAPWPNCAGRGVVAGGAAEDSSGAATFLRCGLYSGVGASSNQDMSSPVEAMLGVPGTRAGAADAGADGDAGSWRVSPGAAGAAEAARAAAAAAAAGDWALPEARGCWPAPCGAPAMCSSPAGAYCAAVGACCAAAGAGANASSSAKLPRCMSAAGGATGADRWAAGAGCETSAWAGVSGACAGSVPGTAAKAASATSSGTGRLRRRHCGPTPISSRNTAERRSLIAQNASR